MGGFKTNHLSPLPAEVSGVSIISQINAGPLEGATSSTCICLIILLFPIRQGLKHGAFKFTPLDDRHGRLHFPHILFNPTNDN